jgi:excisionase family DNA binding protein
MRNLDRVRDLADVLDHLQTTGDLESARKVQRVLESLRQEARSATADLITTGEAARMLGLGSVNTIKRWVRDGSLEGFRRGGRIMVSRASVERLIDAPVVARERVVERELVAAIEPFGPDLTEGELPTSAAWEGRTPWEQVAPPAVARAR